MKKIKVLQQVLDPRGSGGVSAEYRALANSSLSNEFEFEPMILNDFHSGVNKKDIDFYYKKIKEYQPDIIHIRGAAVDGLNAEIAAKKYGKAKILVCIHGMYSEMAYLNPVKKWIAKHIIEPKCFKLADGISCVYKNGVNVPQLKKYQNKLVQFVYNRMPDYSMYDRNTERKQIRSSLNISENSAIAIYCGGVSKEKGMVNFEKCLIKMSTNWNPSFHIVLCGDGDYKKRLEDICKQYKVDQYVHFAGLINNVPQYLLAADFFIMPSLHENHSIAILEALSAGLPCLVTNVGGNCESVENGVTGILVEPNDIDKFIDSIEFLQNEENRKIFIDNIKKKDYSMFQNESVDKQLREAYMAVIK